MTARPSIATRIKEQAIGLGFDAVGIARADAIPDAPARLRAFLDDARHGDMVWMETRAGERADPQTLWPAARSVVMLGLNYGPEADPLSVLARRDRGGVSVYARGRDYHDVVRKKLKALGRFIAETFACEVKVFVDTAPVMEKPLAEAAGLGWQGKHTNLVSRALGSWLFLGAVFTTLDLEADEKEADHCGRCRRCLDVCPTGAFPAPYQLDARRCISYLTIEHRGPIPQKLRAAIGNRIYGCDDCLAVCPWNKFASVSREAQLRERADLAAPPLDALSTLDDAGFRARFSGSPIKRVGRDRFIRNVLIAIGNSGEPALGGRARALLSDPSPLVRGAAIWALSRLLTADDLAALEDENAGTETDPGVLAEWRDAVS
jgi:epoxyqueuosine reductase